MRSSSDLRDDQRAPAIDTTGIAPMSHAQDLMLPLRDDIVTEADHRADYQRVAPAVEDGLVSRPARDRVIASTIAEVVAGARARKKSRASS